MAPIPPAWSPPIADFLRFQRNAGLPATTLYTRRQHLEHLARRIGLALPEVTGEALLDWAGGQDWAPETRRGRRTTFRGFWRWAVATGRTAVDAAAALPKVKPSTPLPRPTPDGVLRAAQGQADARTALMMRCAAELGMRRGEIARLHADDVTEDLVGWSVLVHGKGDKRRMVPSPPGLAQQLAAAGGFVFPGQIDGHLSPRRVGELVNGLLEGAWTIHSLRHRAGTRWYAVDRDVFTVQELLGHASPATTRRYVQVPRDALRRTVLAAAP